MNCLDAWAVSAWSSGHENVGAEDIPVNENSRRPAKAQSIRETAALVRQMAAAMSLVVDRQELLKHAAELEREAKRLDLEAPPDH